jgi:hypothetical protein
MSGYQQTGWLQIVWDALAEEDEVRREFMLDFANQLRKKSLPVTSPQAIQENVA